MAHIYFYYCDAMSVDPYTKYFSSKSFTLGLDTANGNPKWALTASGSPCFGQSLAPIAGTSSFAVGGRYSGSLLFFPPAKYIAQGLPYAGYGAFLARAYYHSTSANFRIQPETTSIPSNSSNNGLRIYPNPFEEQATVLWSNAMGSALIKVMDATGRILQTQCISQEQIQNGYQLEMAGLQAGLYFISVNTNETRRTLPLIKR